MTETENNIHPRDKGENPALAPVPKVSPNKRPDGKVYPTAPSAKQISLSETKSDTALLGGKKYDTKKPRFSLIPQGTLFQVVNVLEHGATKYGFENWKLVDNARQRYFDATQRHLNAWWHGEKIDPDTGENHLAHAICSLMFLLYMDS